MRAELIEDGGLGASSQDFFRSPEYLAATGTSHTLTLTGADGLFVAPLEVRRIDGAPDRRDAISPYGYPGILAAGGPEDSGQGTRARFDSEVVDWSATGLVSIFFRHRLGAEPLFVGATERATVQISDPELPRKSRMSDRQQIRKNHRAGLTVRWLPGPEVSEHERTSFVQAYTETMTRTGASTGYYFDETYFEQVLSSPLSWLFLAESPEGEVAAASIAVRSDGMIHYFLSGTADRHLRGAPMKNVLAEMTDFAWERSLPLNLGGGITVGDRLEEFKRGFANRQEPWRTSEVVCDHDAYARLSKGGTAAGSFFPAYRVPS